MSIEKELTELAQKMFNEQQKFLLDQKPLNDAVAAYVRAKVRETLDRIEGQEGEIEMWQVITEIRKEIE